MDAHHLIQLVEREGCLKIREGVFLQTSDDIKMEQRTWNSEDHAKNMDFGAHKWWVTTNTGALPEGFSKEETLQEYLEKM